MNHLNPFSARPCKVFKKGKTISLIIIEIERGAIKKFENDSFKKESKFRKHKNGLLIIALVLWFIFGLLICIPFGF